MAITEDMLNNNLNDQVSYADFFHALGYDDNDTIYLRTFYDPDKTNADPQNKEIELRFFDKILPTLQRENEAHRGIFYVVNGGGTNDNAVKAKKKARACFIDGDEGTLKEQLQLLADFPLEPSIIIRTRKSLHPYWITPDGDIRFFREMQERLIRHFGSDPVIKNESRVMRLYGFNHCKQDPVEIRLIKFDPQLTYTQKQLHEVLPELPKEELTGKKERKQKAPGEIIPHGQRHKYVVGQIGHYVVKIPDASENVIMETVYADFLENCEQIPQDSRAEFERRYMPAIRKFKAKEEARATDPDFYRKAMQAWKKENPGVDFDSSNASWDDVKAAGLKAQVEEPTDAERDAKIEEGYKQHKEVMQGQNAADPTPQEAPTGKILTPSEEIDAFLDDILTDRYKPVPTGIDNIDKLLGGGLIRQELVTMTAAPGMGKTVLSTQIAESLARYDNKVLFYNFEMSKEQLIARALSRIGVDTLTALQILQGYNMTPDQIAEVKEAAAQYKIRYGDNIEYNPQFFDVNDRKYKNCDRELQHISLSMIQAAERARSEDKPAPIVFIDYLHLILNEGDDQPEVIKKALAFFKEYAVNYNTLVFVILASNRYSNEQGRASMNSGRDTSTIEYSGDVMLSLNYKLTDKKDGMTVQEIQDKIREFTEKNEKIPQEYRLISLTLTKSRFTQAPARTFLEFDGEHSRFKQIQQGAQLKNASEIKEKERTQPSTIDRLREENAKKSKKRQEDREKIKLAYYDLTEDYGEKVTLDALADKVGARTIATLKKQIADLLPHYFIVNTTSDPQTVTLNHEIIDAESETIAEYKQEILNLEHGNSDVTQ